MTARLRQGLCSCSGARHLVASRVVPFLLFPDGIASRMTRVRRLLTVIGFATRGEGEEEVLAADPWVRCPTTAWWRRRRSPCASAGRYRV